MKPIKQYIAEALVLVIALCGIVLGGFLFYAGITVFFDITGSGYILLSLHILLSVLVFALAAYITYISYLMLRGTSYMAIKPFSVLIALVFFIWISPVSNSLAIKASERGMRLLAMILGIANFPLTLLVYGVCVRVLKKLCAIRRGPTPDVKMPNSH